MASSKVNFVPIQFTGAPLCQSRGEFLSNHKRDQAELVNLYHLARTALSGRETEGGRTYRHNRMLYASSEFHKAHPEVSVTGAYKDLDGLLAWD